MTRNGPLLRSPVGRAVVAIATAAATVAAARAAEPDVRRLVLALGSGRVAVREAAERELLALGPAALPAITEASVDTVGEAAFRLRGIRRALEEEAAAEALDGGQVTVSAAGVEPIGAAAAVRVRLRIAWNEGRAPLVVKLPLQSIVAEGSNGEVLPPAQRAAVLEAAVPADRRWLELPIVLQQPAPPVETLAILRGTLTTWLTGMEHAFTFTIDDATAGGPARTVRLGKATVSLDEAVRRGDRLLVTTTIAYDTPTEALASHRPWLERRPLELVAADGALTAATRQTVRSRSDRGLTTTAEFSAPAGGLGRVRWRLPIAIHEGPVDFAIRDIPLPEK